MITEMAVPVFTHLRRLTDAGGLYEHAAGIVPRREHGYCVDDVARALVVVCREPGAELDDLRDQYLSFVLAAQESRCGTTIPVSSASSSIACGKAVETTGRPAATASINTPDVTCSRES